MAAFNPPGWLQNAGATHTAVQLRSYYSGLVAGARASASLVSRGGVNPALGNKLQVTQTGSPSMAVIIKSGFGVIPGTENAAQGAYGVLNDADVTVAVTAAHATLARIDLVCFKVEDSQYSGAANTSSLVVVAGTPSGSPAVPAAPNNALILAQVAVGAAVSTIVNANITDRRTWLDQGTILCTSTTRPAAGTVGIGQVIAQSDNNRAYVTWDGGTSWVEITKRKYLAGVAFSVGGDQTFAPGTPVVSNVTFTAEIGNTYIGTVTGRIKGSNAGNGCIFTGKHRAGTGPAVFADPTTSGSQQYTTPTDTTVIENYTFITEFVASASGNYTFGFAVNFFSGAGTVTVYSNATSMIRIAVTEAIPV